MSLNWQPLQEELAIWQAEARTLPLWWRDDDAVADTPALRQLSQSAAHAGLPVHIAVIPVYVEQSLVARVAADPTLVPVVHGWAHRSHAVAFDKNAEFGAHRPLGLMAEEAARGLDRLTSLFGARVAPIFVPPWNRVDPRLLPDLQRAGFHVVSTFKPRKTRSPVPGLLQVNTHIDPIDWHGSRGLMEGDVLIAKIVRLLQDRRSGRRDAEEPLGLITHHLDHDPAIWAFCEGLMDLMLSGPAHPWTYDPSA